jgi:hypothetical protein
MALAVPLSRFTPRGRHGSAFHVRRSRHAFMKRIIITLAILALPSGFAFARLVAWPNTKPPTLPMPEAYGLAEQALGSATNVFYCVHANTQVAFTLNGEWLFGFSSTNGALKDVVVPFDKKEKPRVIDGGVISY